MEGPSLRRGQWRVVQSSSRPRSSPRGQGKFPSQSDLLAYLEHRLTEMQLGHARLEGSPEGRTREAMETTMEMGRIVKQRFKCSMDY